MYRKRKYGSRKYNNAAAAAVREQNRLGAPPPDYPLILPELRRRILVENYDFSEIVRHEILLYKTRSYLKNSLIKFASWHEAKN